MSKKSVIIPIAVLMITLLSLVALHSRASDPFERNEKFNKSHVNLQIAFSTLVNGKPGITGALLVEKPSRVLFKALGKGVAFSASNTERGYVEIDNEELIYDESGGGGGLAVRASRISSAPSGAPNVIFTPNLKRVFPTNPTVTPHLDGDDIYGIAKEAMGTTEVWAHVNEVGEIISYRIKSVGVANTSDRSWNLQYSFPSSLSLGSFLTPLPLGYQAFALAKEEFPLQKGQMIPSSGWTNASGSAKIDLLDSANHKAFVLAFLDGEGPSKAAIPALNGIKAKVPVLIVGPGSLHDSNGKMTAKFNLPGYPMFYLIDGTGKIMNLWFGFDRAKPEKFESEIINSAAKTPVMKSTKI